MTIHKHIARVALTLGIAAAASLVGIDSVDAASTPTCKTSVSGVLSDGRLIDRRVTNTSSDAEYQSADPLPFPVDNLVLMNGESIAGGSVGHFNTFSAHTRPSNIDFTEHDGSTVATVDVTGMYSKVFGPRLVAGSARYYVYVVDSHGRLVRWTREATADGDLWFAYAKVVARHQGGLRTLSYSWTFKTGAGWTDVLYGTTRSGALKQIKVPWKRPASPRITTVKASGFAAYTGLSLSFCGTDPSYVSIIGIDRVHNRARWYTLRRSLSSRTASLVRRGYVAPGADWRLHATS